MLREMLHPRGPLQLSSNSAKLHKTLHVQFTTSTNLFLRFLDMGRFSGTHLYLCKMACPIDHVLHSSYAHKVTQAWSSECATAIPATSLVWPLFIVDDDDAKQEIGAMPDQCRWGVNRLQEALDEPVANGLQAVLLFGVVGVSAGLPRRTIAAQPAGKSSARAQSIFSATDYQCAHNFPSSHTMCRTPRSPLRPTARTRVIHLS